jgi:hypothetical protein
MSADGRDRAQPGDEHEGDGDGKEAVHCRPIFSGPTGVLERGRAPVQLDACLLEVHEAPSDGGLPGVEIDGEVVSVAIFVGVLELVESTVLSIQ